MKASLFITLILFKSLLIDPTSAAFVGKSEWDCVNNVLFNRQVMETLLGMPEEACADGLPAISGLFDRVALIDSEGGEAEFEEQFLETPITPDTLGLSASAAQHFIDRQHNAALEEFTLDVNFDQKPPVHLKLDNLITLDIGARQETAKETLEQEEEAQPLDLSGFDLSLSGLDLDGPVANRQRDTDVEEGRLEFERLDVNTKFVNNQEELEDLHEQLDQLEEDLRTSQPETKLDPNLLPDRVMQEPGLAIETLSTIKQADTGLGEDEDLEQPLDTVAVNLISKELGQSGVKLNIGGHETTTQQVQEELISSGLGDSLSLSDLDFGETNGPRRRDESFLQVNDPEVIRVDTNTVVKPRGASDIIAPDASLHTSAKQPPIGEEKEIVQDLTDPMQSVLTASLLKDAPSLTQSRVGDSKASVKVSELKRVDSLANSVAKLNVDATTKQELVTSTHSALLEGSQADEFELPDLDFLDSLGPQGNKRLDKHEQDVEIIKVDQNTVFKKNELGSTIEEPLDEILRSTPEQQPGLTTSTTLKDSVADLHIQTREEPQVHFKEEVEAVEQSIPDLTLSLFDSQPGNQKSPARKLDTSEDELVVERRDINTVPKVAPTDLITSEKPALTTSVHDKKPVTSLTESVPDYNLDDLFDNEEQEEPVAKQQPGLTTSALLKDDTVHLTINVKEEPQVNIAEEQVVEEENIPDLTLSLFDSQPGDPKSPTRKLDTSEHEIVVERRDINTVPKIAPSDLLVSEKPALFVKSPSVSLSDSLSDPMLDQLFKTEEPLPKNQPGLTTSTLLKDNSVDLHIQTKEEPQIHFKEEVEAVEQSIPDLTLSLFDSQPEGQKLPARKLDTSEGSVVIERRDINTLIKDIPTEIVKKEEEGPQVVGPNGKPTISLVDSLSSFELDNLFKTEKPAIIQPIIDNQPGLTTSTLLKDSSVDLHIQTKEEPKVNIKEEVEAVEQSIPDLTLSLFDSQPDEQKLPARKLDTSEGEVVVERRDINTVPKVTPTDLIGDQDKQPPIDLTITPNIDLSELLHDSLPHDQEPSLSSVLGPTTSSKGPGEDIQLRLSEARKSHVSIQNSVVEDSFDVELSDLDLSGPGPHRQPKKRDEEESQVEVERVETQTVPVKLEDSELPPGTITKKIQKTIIDPNIKLPPADRREDQEEEPLDFTTSLIDLEKSTPIVKENPPSVQVDLTTSEAKKTDIHTSEQPVNPDLIITDLDLSLSLSLSDGKTRPRDIDQSEDPKVIKQQINTKPITPPLDDDVEFFDIKGFNPSINDSSDSLPDFSEQPKPIPTDWTFDPNELLTSSTLKDFEGPEDSLHSSKSSVDSSKSSLHSSKSSVDSSKSSVDSSKSSLHSSLSLSHSEIAESQVLPPHHDDLIISHPSSLDSISERSDPSKPLINSKVDPLKKPSDPSLTDISLPEKSLPREVPNKPFDPKRFVERPTGPLTFSNLSEKEKDPRRGEHGKTYFVAQPVHRVLPSVIQQTRAMVAERTFRAFPLLHKCVQRALEQCRPNAEKLKKVCRDAHGRDCDLTNFVVRLQCADNEELINNACYSKCPEGFTDYKLFCLKPPYALRRTWKYTGQPLAKGEKLYGDDLVVEDCANYGRFMRDVGPDYCGSRCPDGFLDRGTLCQKPARFQNQQLYTFTKATANVRD